MELSIDLSKMDLDVDSNVVYDKMIGIMVEKVIFVSDYNKITTDEAIDVVINSLKEKLKEEVELFNRNKEKIVLQSDKEGLTVSDNDDMLGDEFMNEIHKKLEEYKKQTDISEKDKLASDIFENLTIHNKKLEEDLDLMENDMGKYVAEKYGQEIQCKQELCNDNELKDADDLLKDSCKHLNIKEEDINVNSWQTNLKEENLDYFISLNKDMIRIVDTPCFLINGKTKELVKTSADENDNTKAVCVRDKKLMFNDFIELIKNTKEIIYLYKILRNDAIDVYTLTPIKSKMSLVRMATQEDIK